jgi:PKHD-type hydroxylase
LIAYPATTLHRVAPVTEGVRTSAVGWVQSELRDAAQRAILFDLDVVRRNIFGSEGKSRNFDMVSKAHANLLHLWTEL